MTHIQPQCLSQPKTSAVILASLTLLLVSGCRPSATTKPAPAAAAQQGDPADADAHTGGHDHNHDHGDGPHGGTLTDWGGGTYHVEFTVDHDAQEATVYVLGADEKTPMPIKPMGNALLLTILEPAFQIELAPRPLAGEEGGLASCYVGSHASLGIVRELAGTISGEVDGTPYAGDFAEHAHE
jgi:hypothetical protein